jgi:hypothetical protein
MPLMLAVPHPASTPFWDRTGVGTSTSRQITLTASYHHLCVIRSPPCCLRSFVRIRSQCNRGLALWQRPRRLLSLFINRASRCNNPLGALLCQYTTGNDDYCGIQYRLLPNNGAYWLGPKLTWLCLRDRGRIESLRVFASWPCCRTVPYPSCYD